MTYITLYINCMPIFKNEKKILQEKIKELVAMVSKDVQRRRVLKSLRRFSFSLR